MRTHCGLLNDGIVKEVGVPSCSRRAHRQGMKKRELYARKKCPDLEMSTATGMRGRAESGVALDSRRGTVTIWILIPNYIFRPQALQSVSSPACTPGLGFSETPEIQRNREVATIPQIIALPCALSPCSHLEAVDISNFDNCSEFGAPWRQTWTARQRLL